MTVLQYEAKEVNAKLEGRPIPSIEKVVQVTMSEKKPMKLEVIVHGVSLRTRIDKDSDLNGKVSAILRKMEENKLVSHVDHGFWQLL